MFESMKENTLSEINKYQLSSKELELLDKVCSYASEKGIGDTFEFSIREIRSDSNYFVNIMKRDLMREKFGSDFEFAKLMVTKINPNTIAAFKPAMLLTKKDVESKNKELIIQKQKNREFFVDYFLNECDLSMASIVKATRVIEVGFMSSKEVEAFREKRNKEIHKFASKNDYNRASCVVIETR